MQKITAYREEICDCGCGVIRAGHGTKKYGDPYDFAVVHDRHGTVKALVVPQLPWWLRWLPVRPFTRAYFKAIYDAIPMKPNWERYK